MMDKLERLLVPIAEKLGNNKVLGAIRDGFLITTPLIIVSSIFLLIANLPIDGYPEFMAGVFGPTWKSYLTSVSGATLNLMGVLSLIGISYSYAKVKKVNAMAATTVALVSFVVVTKQANIIEIISGDDVLSTTFSGLGFANINSNAIFLSMIVGIVSVIIFSFVIKKGWTIKMPEGVPPAVVDSFTALIPSAFVITFFFIVRTGFQLTSFGYANDFIFKILQEPLVGFGKTDFYLPISRTMSSLFWFFGINGPAVTNTIFTPIGRALTNENLAFFEQGLRGPNIYTNPFSNFFGGWGGGGSTLSLVIVMLLFAKSQRLKKLGQLSIVPGIFGINEMIIFGFPIVLNPIMIFPFVVIPTMNVILSGIMTSIGFLPFTTGVDLPWTTPIVVSGFLATQSIIGSIWQIVLLVLGCLIYYPFFKLADKRYLEEESNISTEDDGLGDISFDDLSFD